MARPRRGAEIAPDSIIETAAEVFATHGYAGTTLDEVARRLGVTRQAVIHRFSGKRELFRAVLDRDRRWAERMAITAAEADDVSPFSPLVRFLELSDDGRQRVRLQHVLQGEAIAGDPVAQEFVTERTATIRAQILKRAERAAALGLLAPGWTPEAAATVVFALINGLQALALIDPAISIREAFARAIAALTTVEGK